MFRRSRTDVNMDALSYECINCGGPLQFNAEKGAFFCQYCRGTFSEKDIEEHYAEENAKADQAHVEEKEPDPDDFFGNAALFECNTCGAEVIADKNTAATFCVYCHNPVVLTNRLAGEYKPNKVIPFKISEKEAKERFTAFCKKKMFLPKDFVSNAQLDMMKGVYYPYWLVDTQKAGGIEATGKKKRRWKEGDYEYEETKTFSIRRRGIISFKGYPHTALKNDDNLKALKYVNPYNDEEFRPFTMPYLTGFLAEKRDVDRKDIQAEVDGELKDYATKIFRNTIEGYDSVEINSMDLKTINETWDYGMMPVWFMTFIYNGKSYLYAMNGQTGKNYGELPLDKGKLFGVAALVGAGLFLLGTIGGFLFL